MAYKIFIGMITTLVLSSSLIAEDKLTITGATTDSNFVRVVLKIHNKANLTAMIIPLTFTKGVVLKEVNFENTRVEYFDLKVATIDNEKRTVLIGLISQMTPHDLAKGVGTIANLTFEITDPSIKSMTIGTFKILDPCRHIELTFVYRKGGPQSVRRSVQRYPKFSPTTIFFSGIDVNVVEEDSNNLPVESNLGQNYPNPFNSSTTIQFALKRSGDYKLTIYSTTGQVVEEFIGTTSCTETTSIEWDASNYASGVYFYQLITDTFKQTKKAVLLK